MRLFTLLLLVSVSFILPVHAQLLPPNQPEQDACNALQLCGNTFTTPFSYQGNGLEADLTQTPCGITAGEGNVVWLKLAINTAGTIVFTITPINNQDDYDFAVINGTGINCNDITPGNVVRCNFNNNQPVFNNGIVGLNTTSTVTSVAAGTTGSSYLQQITAAAGDVYYVMINNFGAGGGPSSGFTVNFAGSTATFNNPPAPHLNTVTSATSCTYRNTVTVHLNTPIACNSITATGSDFQLTPGGTIVSASGVNCNGLNGYTQDVVLNFAPALPPAAYTLNPKVGTDGNTLLNLCGNAVPITDALNFSVNANAAFATASLNCTTLTLTTNVPVKCASIAANASDFNITGPGGAVTATNAVGVNCNPAGFSNTITITLAGPITTTGTYTVHAQNGTDGNTLLDDCDLGIPVGNTVTFDAVAKPTLTLPANLTTCINDGVILPLQVTNQAAGVTYTYNWTPAAGLNNATIAQPLADPTGDQSYTVTVGSTNTSMCTSTATVAVHSLQGFDITNDNAVICEGASVQINVTGSDEYTYVWTPTTGVSNPNIKNPVITPPLGTTIYALTASHAGCTDSTQFITLEVQPNPEGIQLFTDKTSVCKYDTITLHAIASPSTFNFTYVWQPAADMMFNGGPNNAYIGNTSGNITVTATTPIGCTASASTFITVFPGDFLQVNTNDTGYCVSGEIQLEASNAVSYKWSPSMGLSATDIANPVASPHTTTNYMVIGKDVHGCRDTQNVTVGVYPAATVNMPDSVKVYHGEVYQLEPNTNCTYFSWFPPAGIDNVNSGDPSFNPEVRTRYFVTASTEHGCATVDSIDILIEETVIDMPNAFAPGTGGANSIFKPAKRGIAKLNSFNIYNRWGQKVYESSNIDKGWDGTFNDKAQPMGVYVYTIDYVTDAGSAIVKQGNVTLLR